MFFDFSSAFNTIQPRLLRAKLENMQVDAPLVSWIEDYLTGRPQFVRLRSCVSDPLMSNTGAPQGTVLSPFLFTTYTADFQNHSKTCHLQKYLDVWRMDRRMNTGTLWRVLSGGAGRTFCSSTFLGVQLDNKLEWSTNTDAVYKKAMSRLYFLRRLGSFSVCSRMLHMFYQSVMASTISFAVVLANLDEVVRDRMVLKLQTIMDSRYRKSFLPSTIKL
ncbi:hypothetical protein D4764_0100770 [Takifugu flavidus]|uniref:Reverse transcriptase domain-containing protein n=1 Tax=Takifugu flavidus TaxID=433684 RepID=A0A5C6MIF7_9TELE|nr:hypothetical protein D4764_0100770 [Takifugu flavidus]